MKKFIILSVSLLSLLATLLYTPASQAGGPNVFVNLGPYGAVGYPAGYVYPVNNGCCGGCVYSNPINAYYNPYYNSNKYAVGNQAFNNPYVFDTTNINNVGRIAPVHMNPRNPYGY